MAVLPAENSVKYIYNNINTSQITSNCRSQNYIKIQNACTYISQNCEKDLSQKDISDIFGFSHFYFSRLFKEYTHMTFNDYLSNERIQRATRLLCEEALPITEIAYQSGFQSISNFNRVFNKITHYSPEIKSPQVNVGSFNTYTNIFSITFFKDSSAEKAVMYSNPTYPSYPLSASS